MPKNAHNTDKIRGGKPSHMLTVMQILNPSTSAKSVMIKLFIHY